MGRVNEAKLSEIKLGQFLLYDNETVSLQYVLRQIYEGQTIKETLLISNQEQMDVAIQNVLRNVYFDTLKGVDKDSYSLGKLDTIPVVIDVTKEEIIESNGFYVINK